MTEITIQDKIEDVGISASDLIALSSLPNINPRKRIGEGYCGYRGIVIEGTKFPHPRGYDYDLVVILPNKDIVFGHEEGNYAGGVVLSPTGKNYEEIKLKRLDFLKSVDKDFYDLIMEELSNL